MSKKYTIKEVVDNRWAIWEQIFPKAQGNKIGVYKIFDLSKDSKPARFAFRYRPRKGQTQEESDKAIIDRAIALFYKQKPVYFNRGEQDSIKA